jgi:hypothetical protein
MRGLVRDRDIAWQTLQVALHARRRALELRKMLFAQSLEPERTGPCHEVRCSSAAPRLVATPEEGAV